MGTSLGPAAAWRPAGWAETLLLNTDCREVETWRETLWQNLSFCKAKQDTGPGATAVARCALPTGCFEAAAGDCCCACLGLKRLGFLVYNKISPLVSWPSELLPAWHFIINTFFPSWYWFPAILLLLRFYFLFYSSLPIDRNILVLASSKGRRDWCPYAGSRIAFRAFGERQGEAFKSSFQRSLKHN